MVGNFPIGRPRPLLIDRPPNFKRLWHVASSCLINKVCKTPARALLPYPKHCRRTRTGSSWRSIRSEWSRDGPWPGSRCRTRTWPAWKRSETANTKRTGAVNGACANEADDDRSRYQTVERDDQCAPLRVQEVRVLQYGPLVPRHSQRLHGPSRPQVGRPQGHMAGVYRVHGRRAHAGRLTPGVHVGAKFPRNALFVKRRRERRNETLHQRRGESYKVYGTRRRSTVLPSLVVCGKN